MYKKVNKLRLYHFLQSTCFVVRRRCSESNTRGVGDAVQGSGYLKVIVGVGARGSGGIVIGGGGSVGDLPPVPTPSTGT